MEFILYSYVSINIQFIECNSLFSSLLSSQTISYAGNFNVFPFKTEKRKKNVIIRLPISPSS